MTNTAPSSFASAVANIHAHARVTEVLDAARKAVLEQVREVDRVEFLTTTADEVPSVRHQPGKPLGADEAATFTVEERGRQVISLKVYPAASTALNASALGSTALIARHTALALSHARRFENLQAALESRTAIGVAIGLLMERLRVDEDAAFAYLTRLAETSERKVREVAAGIVSEHVHALTSRRRPPKS